MRDLGIRSGCLCRIFCVMLLYVIRDRRLSVTNHLTSDMRDRLWLHI